MPDSMLNLRIVQGPLEPYANEVILSEYNRLTSSQIPMRDFLHWIQNSPAGPSWHAIFETDERRIVGHTCLIPLRARCNGKWLVPAKSEYGFIIEEFRTAKVRGFDSMPRPRNRILRHQILLLELFQQCRSVGWGPFLISGSRKLQRLCPQPECYRVSFPLRECLLVLRPRNAALKTPNLNQWQRAVLGLMGVPQRTAWSIVSSFQARGREIRPVPIADFYSPIADDSLSFFEDEDSLRWRYLAGQYERLALDQTGEEYVIVKKGSPGSYLRVCQWKLSSPKQVTFSLICRLVQMALEERALGVRWAVYGDDQCTKHVARRLRGFGFLTTRRVRTLLIQSQEPEFLMPERWRLNDSMFSFDF